MKWRAGSQACRDPSASASGSRAQSRALSASVAAAAAAFLSRVFFSKGPAEATAAKRPAARARQLRHQPPSPQCANKGICMKAGAPFAEKDPFGGASRFAAPNSCAPLPGRGSRGAGDPATQGPPHTNPSAGRPAEAAVWARASADSSTLFTEAWERGLGVQAPPRGGRGTSQAATEPGLGSQPNPPRPKPPSISSHVRRGRVNVTKLVSNRKAAEGCAGGTQKGLSECGFRCPFPELFALSRLFRNPSQQPLEAGDTKWEEQGSGARET